MTGKVQGKNHKENADLKAILGPEEYRVVHLFKMLPKSSLMAAILGMSGSMLNNDFFNHPTNMISVGILPYFILMAVGSLINYIV